MSQPIKHELSVGPRSLGRHAKSATTLIIIHLDNDVEHHDSYKVAIDVIRGSSALLPIPRFVTACACEWRFGPEEADASLSSACACISSEDLTAHRVMTLDHLVSHFLQEDQSQTNAVALSSALQTACIVIIDRHSVSEGPCIL